MTALAIRWRHAAWFAAALVLLLSLIPTTLPAAADTIGVDKLIHCILYAALMYCFARGYSPRHWPLLAVLLIVYGGAIEGLQGLTRYRSASLADALANSTGISIMLLGLARGERRQRYHFH